MHDVAQRRASDEVKRIASHQGQGRFCPWGKNSHVVRRDDLNVIYDITQHPALVEELFTMTAARKTKLMITR